MSLKLAYRRDSKPRYRRERARWLDCELMNDTVRSLFLRSRKESRVHYRVFWCFFFISRVFSTCSIPGSAAATASSPRMPSIRMRVLSSERKRRRVARLALRIRLRAVSAEPAAPVVWTCGFPWSFISAKRKS